MNGCGNAFLLRIITYLYYQINPVSTTSPYTWIYMDRQINGQRLIRYIAASYHHPINMIIIFTSSGCFVVNIPRTFTFTYKYLLPSATILSLVLMGCSVSQLPFVCLKPCHHRHATIQTHTYSMRRYDMMRARIQIIIYLYIFG